MSGVSTEEPSVPKAYLQYILFDENWNFVSSDEVTISSAAASQFEELSLEGVIANDGYLYVYVVNESNANVHFDDMTVGVTGLNVLSTRNYYPYGSVAQEWKNPDFDDRYRFGYQGQFAEEDTVTGWNHFEAREYDSKIARWTSVDPLRIGNSPYIGMANNPIRLIDETGEGPGLIIVNIQHMPENFSYTKFAKLLEAELIKNGAHGDTKVVVKGSTAWGDMSWWEQNTIFDGFDQSASATITIREFNIDDMADFNTAAGYGRNGDVHISKGLVSVQQLYEAGMNGANSNAAMSMLMKIGGYSEQDYVNIALHELGHAVYDFIGPPFGHQGKEGFYPGGGLMDGPSVWKAIFGE